MWEERRLTLDRARGGEFRWPNNTFVTYVERRHGVILGVVLSTLFYFVSVPTRKFGLMMGGAVIGFVGPGP